MSTNDHRIPPSHEALKHHLSANSKRLAEQCASRDEFVQFIASLGEGWR